MNAPGLSIAFAIGIALLVGGGAIAQTAATPLERLAPPDALAPPEAPGAAAALEVPRPAGLDPGALVKRAGDRAARISEREWDVDARAEALGPGVEPAFAYVRDAIRYEAYAGVLRGASGTYTARAGNAADRALLLARLLAAKGVRTRFALGTLAAAERERLWRRTFDTAPPPPPALQAGGAASDAGNAFRRRVHARAARDYSVVRAALGDRLPPVTVPTREEVLAELDPHVWVQAEADGRWIDLDPSFPDGKAGTPIAAAERTAAELPPDLHQRVTIRLALEQLEEGKLEVSTLLELSRAAVDLMDRQVFVVHAPGKPIPLAGLGASLGGRGTWTPGIWLAGGFVWGKTFAIEEGGAAPGGEGGKAPKEAGGGILDAVDALSPEPGPGAKTAAGPVFVAEWLEFELTGPGLPREVTRRVLAERGGATWRAARPLRPSGLKPLRRDAGGPLALRALHNVWFSSGPHDLAAYADAMQDLAVESLSLAAGEDPSVVDDFGASVWPTALENFTWMVWTDHAVIPALNDTPGVRLYADRPRIAVFTRGPDADDGMLVMSDLRRDDLRALAASPAQAAVLAEKKLWFATLQGALEHEGIAEALAASGADPRSVETASGRLGADGVVVLAPGSPLPAAPPALDPDSAARLTAALGAGAVVVAPVAGRGAGGWWEILPGTGEVRAVGELGLNAGRGGIPGNTNPLRHIRAPQQNPVGGQKPVYTPEAAKEARDAARQARNARRVQDNIKNYNASRDAMARQPKGGGAEYALLITAIMVVGSAAQGALMYYTAMNVMAAIDALSQ